MLPKNLQAKPQVSVKSWALGNCWKLDARWKVFDIWRALIYCQQPLSTRIQWRTALDFCIFHWCKYLVPGWRGYAAGTIAVWWLRLLQWKKHRSYTAATWQLLNWIYCPSRFDLPGGAPWPPSRLRTRTWKNTGNPNCWARINFNLRNKLKSG